MNYKFFIGLAVLSLGVTACHDDVSFDQKTYDDLINQAFPIQNVDPQHNWATMGTATASISVKKEAAPPPPLIRTLHFSSFCGS